VTVPARWIAIVLDGLACLLLLAKTYSYFVETVWFAKHGAARLLPSYVSDQQRSHEKDIAAGRPMPLVGRIYSSGSDNRSSLQTWAILGFKAPAIVMAAAAVSFGVGTWCPAPLALTFSVCMAVLLLGILLTALTMRLVLGPYDALNPDLNLGPRISRYVYRDRQPLSLYILVLIGISIVGFASIYANVNHAVHGSFDTGSSVDPSVGSISPSR
jgi:hypothetical protein